MKISYISKFQVIDFFNYGKVKPPSMKSVRLLYLQATKPKVNVCLFHSVLPEDKTKKPPAFTLKCKA